LFLSTLAPASLPFLQAQVLFWDGCENCWMVEIPVLGFSKCQKSHGASSAEYICWGVAGIWLFVYSPKTAAVRWRGDAIHRHNTEPNWHICC
jgi:hypothetical protein